MFVFCVCASILAIALGVGARHTEVERSYARNAYHYARGYLAGSGRSNHHPSEVLRYAAANYQAEHGDWPKGERDLREFIHRWAVLHPGPSFRDTDRPGAIPRMTDAECKLCVQELRRGYEDEDGKFRLYISLDHAAEFPNRCPTIAECRARYADHDEWGMWRRLLSHDPNLYRFQPRLVHNMHPKVMAERVAASRFYREQGLAYRTRIFYIDTHTIIFHPKSGWVIGYRKDGAGHYIEDSDIRCYDNITHKSDTVRVNFYSMINYYGGVCGFFLCQGTTGLPYKYKASVSNPHSDIPLGLGLACCTAQAHQ